MSRIVVVTGATGHVGKAVAEGLLAKGLQVRAIGRSADRLRELMDQGAEPWVGSVSDAEFLAGAFAGADAAFVMVPPSYAEPSFLAHQRGIVDAYAEALRKSGHSRAVTLSSVGAERESGTGPIVTLHRLERQLDAIPSLSVLHLRAAFFLENHLHNLGLIRHQGINGGTQAAEVSIAMVATRDIAAVAVEHLTSGEISGKSHRYLLGSRDVSFGEATRVLGSAIGNPELAYVQFPEPDARQAMIGAGMSEEVADLFLEMNRGLSTGWIAPEKPRGEKNSTPTSIETFAAEVFAPAYAAG